MIIKKYNKKLHKNEDYEAPEGCKFYSNDMEEIVVCPGCGEKFKVGNGYTSRVYFEPNAIWGMIVCPKCHRKEMREIFE